MIHVEVTLVFHLSEILHVQLVVVVYEEHIGEMDYLLLIDDLVLNLKPAFTGLLFVPHGVVELVAFQDGLALDLLFDVVDRPDLVVMNVEENIIQVALKLGNELLIVEDVDHLSVQICA